LIVAPASDSSVILDRLVHNAHRLDLTGESLRKTKSNPTP
jgi:hypothetical protein